MRNYKEHIPTPQELSKTLAKMTAIILMITAFLVSVYHVQTTKFHERNENKIEVFSSAEFGAVRTLKTEDGKVLFYVEAVAKAMGLQQCKRGTFKTLQK